MVFETRDDKKLPCPECRDRGSKGGRIGNAKNRCGTCNRFNQNVRRRTLVRLKNRFREEYDQERVLAEVEAYPAVIDEFVLRKIEGLM